jgi:hypothetical protein
MALLTERLRTDEDTVLAERGADLGQHAAGHVRCKMAQPAIPHDHVVGRARKGLLNSVE